MQWCFDDDKTQPIITARRNIESDHGKYETSTLPETCVIFQMGGAISYIEQKFATITLSEKLPCFLDNPRAKCIMISEHPNVCFTRGGYGAPAAVDALETMFAMGVKRVLIAGLCGVFADSPQIGDVVVPTKILAEEGVSRHYFANLEYAMPDKTMHSKASMAFQSHQRIHINPTVTVDAVYRETPFKEEYWRNLGCIGVDMEASALLSVSKYYDIPAVAMLLVSDKHPVPPKNEQWSWGLAKCPEARKSFIESAVALSICY